MLRPFHSRKTGASVRFVPPPPRPPPLRHRLRRVLVSTATPASACDRSDAASFVSGSCTSTFIFTLLISSLNHSYYHRLPPSLPPLPSFLIHDNHATVPSPRVPAVTSIATSFRTTRHRLTTPLRHQRQRYTSLHFTFNASTEVTLPDVIL